MFPTPVAVPTVRCRACRKLTRQDRAVDGYGSECAQRRGLIVRRTRRQATPQDGETLLDAAAEDDSCDGWDHPAG